MTGVKSLNEGGINYGGDTRNSVLDVTIPIGSVIPYSIANAANLADDMRDVAAYTKQGVNSSSVDTGTYISGNSSMYLTSTNDSNTMSIQRALDSNVDGSKFRRARFLIKLSGANYSATSSVTISIGSSSKDVAVRTYTIEQLVEGWNSLYVSLTEGSVVGNINESALSFVKIEFSKNFSSSVAVYIDSIYFCPMSDGWEDSNGQTIVDSDSPMNGNVLSDLNNASDVETVARFLRGALVSGTTGGAETSTHSHALTGGAGSNGDYATGGALTTSSRYSNVADSSVDTVPPYSSQVMIIKVK